MKYVQVITPLWCPLTEYRCSQNEKKKDKELTIRIEKILKLRDEVMQGADICKPSSTNWSPAWHVDRLSSEN